MTFISYAQNFEDITLWRAFRLFVANGFYIDVGANDPALDSVTKAFYDRGWTGINIEPSPSYYRRLCAERSRDINLDIAVSDKEGGLIFFDAGDSGRSTVDPAVAADLKKATDHLVERTVDARTLSSICAQYVDREIHFLKIDVEGHEFSVLKGMDFKKWRPWIVLIENPFNLEPAWESLLTDSDYRFAHYDGINRYYVANEHAEVLGAFDTPPNLVDDFQLCYGHRLSYPVAELEAQIAHERRRADAAEARLAEWEAKRWCISRLVERARNFLKKIRMRLGFASS